MNKKAFVALSSTSLIKVWEWCEQNYTDPLADAYMVACTAVGGLDPSIIAARLKVSWSGMDKHGWIDEAYKLYNFSLQHRDTIGRIILGVIKRESPNNLSTPGGAPNPADGMASINSR